MSDWIDPALVKAFEAEGTDAYRICTYLDGWVDRYGTDILVSYKTENAQERMTSELYLWALAVGFKVTRVFARFLPKRNAERESPRLVVSDQESNLQTSATERQLRYGIDFEAGYSVGLFVDQRHNRSYVRQLKSRTLLNCFAYTCAFSVAAADAGSKTLSVDLSKKSLARGQENFTLNGLTITGHRFIAEDVIEYLPRLLRKGEKFDVIILDPPTFSRTHRGKSFQVEQDFETLLSQALEVAARDGKILLSTNCTKLTERALEVMARFCLKASRRAGRLHSEAPLPDFPPGTGARTVWLTLH
ncbi:MAG: class I SAM-dependent rRNA methyltransferase [Chthoniobacterales bacterium]|nr:class I SAM-dependent rRNA methyltransferase [Chthoniobacterales bacterium]